MSPAAATSPRCSTTTTTALERYNMADTLKAQHTAFLTERLRLLLRHGPRAVLHHRRHLRLARHALRRFQRGDGERRSTARRAIQEQRNDYHQQWLRQPAERARQVRAGQARPGAPTSISSARSRPTTPAICSFTPGHSPPGSYVDLRFEMNTLVVLSACQHPLDPATSYQPKDVRLTTWHSRPAPRNDPCRTRCPENERGFRNTEMLVPLMALKDKHAGRRRKPRHRADHSRRRAVDGHACKQASTSASSIWKAIRPSTRCSSARDSSTNATARRTPSARKAIFISPRGTQLLSNEGNTMLTIVADTCGRHDTLGGACSAESNTVRYAHRKAAHAQLPRQLPAGAGALGLEVSPRHWQARPAEQHQFLHERAGDAAGQADVRGWHLSRRAAMSRCAPTWM